MGRGTRGGGLAAAARAAGEVEAFVCTACGYFEEYVKQPEAIDWDQVLGFRWCTTDGREPVEGP